MTPATTAKFPGLAGMMVVRNEAGRYLRLALEDLLSYCETVTVVDDASDDDTPAVLEELGSRHPELTVHRLSQPQFLQNESQLRQHLWAKTVAAGPRWVICLDADELLEERWKAEGAGLLARAGQLGAGLLCFNLHEFWGDKRHYRVDGFWNPHGRFVPTIIRYVPGHPYRWNNHPLHGGRFPENPPGPALNVPLRVKHYGYVNPADQRAKYERYITADPAGRYCPFSHYQSILTPPVLREWVE